MAVPALVGLGLLAAACGGSKPPSVASLTTATSVTTTVASAKPSPAALAACFTAHGFPASVGSASTARAATVDVAGVVFPGDVDPSSPQFQAAMQACRKYLPGGGPPHLTPAQQAEAAKAMAKFADCMRRNGVPNFPDPNSQGMFPPDSLKSIAGLSSPLTVRAFKTCESLEPKHGPHLVLG